MSNAFGCDLCARLEAGAPAQRITVKPALGNAVDLEMCAGCLVSFSEWRLDRAPAQDAPSD